MNAVSAPTVSVDMMPAMRGSAGMAAAFLRTLANEDRLILLCQLTQGECCVSDLEKKVDIRQPTLSQQLAVLRKQKLVGTRREGKNIYYRVNEGLALAVIELLYQQFCENKAPMCS